MSENIHKFNSLIEKITKEYINDDNQDKVLDKLRKRATRLQEKYIYKPYKKDIAKIITNLKHKKSDNYLEEIYIKKQIENLKEELNYISQFTSPKRKQQMEKAYDLAECHMQIAYIKGKNEIWKDLQEILDYECNILKDKWIKGKSNPDRNKNSFLYKMNFDKWSKALVYGAVAYFFTLNKRNDLLYPKYKGRVSPSMMRLLSTAIHYGLNERQTFNYINLVYISKVKKSDMLRTYHILKKNKK